MSKMGVKINGFQDPFCNSFRPVVFRRQLCYEVDPNDYKNGTNKDKLSLSLLVNFNEDRQFNEERKEKSETIGVANVSHTFEIETNTDNGIFIGTISKKVFQKSKLTNFSQLKMLYHFHLDISMFLMWSRK